MHGAAACGVLRDLHDELDRLVARAYGWPWPLSTDEILARIVDLHDERVEEKKRGHVRWLRPEHQVPRFDIARPEAGLDLKCARTKAAARKVEVAEWPSGAIKQLAALRGALADGPLTAELAARRFPGARRDIVARHLDALDTIGAVSAENGRYYLATVAA